MTFLRWWIIYRSVNFNVHETFQTDRRGWLWSRRHPSKTSGLHEITMTGILSCISLIFQVKSTCVLSEVHGIFQRFFREQTLERKSFFLIPTGSGGNWTITTLYTQFLFDENLNEICRAYWLTRVILFIASNFKDLNETENHENMYSILNSR